MSLAVYIKTPPPKPKDPKIERFFFAMMTTVGVVAIGFAIVPMIMWQVSSMQKFSAKVDQYPIPTSQVLNSPQMLESIRVHEDESGFTYFEPEEGSNLLSNLSSLDRPEEFQITIPKIKVNKAKVSVDSVNFNDHLALFPGTAIPGDTGNSFITGHSVLPQFADPDNYRAIFTELIKLEVGDDIEVKVGDKTMHFVVQYSKVVDPKDTSVLLPISKSGKNLTLMTCVPPGTSIKRLVVVTSLI